MKITFPGDQIEKKECSPSVDKASENNPSRLLYACHTYVAGVQDKQGSFHSGEQVRSVFDESSFNKVLVTFPIFLIQSVIIKETQRELESVRKVATLSWRCDQLLSNLHTRLLGSFLQQVAFT